MNKPILKEMLQNEIQFNPAYQKGRKHMLTLVILYLAIRFSDPIVSPILAHVPFELDFSMVFGLLVSLGIASFAMMGRNKLAGALFLMTPIGNIAMMLVAANRYAGGFSEMLHGSPMAWYILVAIFIGTIIGIWMLTDKSIATFGRRRKALQKEYVDLLKAWSTASAVDD